MSKAIDHHKSDDQLYGAARDYVAFYQAASTAMLQRHLSIGYARATRLMDLLEDDGVVGPSVGDKPRKVLIAKTEEKPVIAPQDSGHADSLEVQTREQRIDGKIVGYASVGAMLGFVSMIAYLLNTEWSYLQLGMATYLISTMTIYYFDHVKK